MNEVLLTLAKLGAAGYVLHYVLTTYLTAVMMQTFAQMQFMP